MSNFAAYLRATRHPYPCLLFVLPLLAGYEASVLWLGGQQPETLRNGADNWLRWGLAAVGARHALLPPVAIVLVFIVWSWLRQEDRPGDLVNVFSGMALESVAC